MRKCPAHLQGMKTELIVLRVKLAQAVSWAVDSFVLEAATWAPDAVIGVVEIMLKMFGG